MRLVLLFVPAILAAQIIPMGALPRAIGGGPIPPTGYSHCKVITIANTMVSGGADLTDFPLTVILPADDDLRVAGSGGLVQNSSGFDIGFFPTCTEGASPLTWEMESYSAATGAIVAHVLMPTLHVDGDTIAIAFDGAQSTFQSTASGVWTSAYKGVWHLPSTTVLDSTSGGIGNGTNTAATASTGQIDGDLNFVAATPAFVDFGNPVITYTGLTVSSWIKTSTVNGIFFAEWGTPDCFVLSNFSSTANGAQIGISTNVTSYFVNAPTNVTDGAWHYVASTWSASTNALKLYVDGVQDGSTTTTIGTNLNNASANNLYIGQANSGGPWNGDVDEVRILNTALSANQILTEYRNQHAPGTYLSVGPLI